MEIRLFFGRILGNKSQNLINIIINISRMKWKTEVRSKSTSTGEIVKNMTNGEIGSIKRNGLPK